MAASRVTSGVSTMCYIGKVKYGTLTLFILSEFEN